MDTHMDTMDETVKDVRPLENTLETPKKKIPPIAIIGGVIFLVALLILGISRLRGQKQEETVSSKSEEAAVEETLPSVDASVSVTVAWSKTKDNTVILAASGLSGKYASIGYELQYDSSGVGKGVTSGSKPLDVTGQDSFEREVYLGTCSRNVCKPDTGVKKISAVVEFTDKDGKKSQFSKEYDL